MTPKPWIKAIPIATALFLSGIAYMEVRAKVSKYGWNPSDWPIEISFLTESSGHNLFFVLFILAPLFAVYLAFARHGGENTE